MPGRLRSAATLAVIGAIAAWAGRAQAARTTITIGNGSAEPSNASISAGAVGAIDAFWLQASANTTATGVTVSLSFSAGAPLTNVFVSSSATCAGGTTYGTLASPVAGTNTITLTTGISVTTSQGPDLFVCGTAAAIASTATVTGTVSSVTVTATGSTSTDSDTTSATLTVLAAPTVTIGNGSAEPANASISAGAVAAFDTFSLQTNTGAAAVTSVTVSLTFTGTPLTNVFVSSSSTCTGGTTYGTLASPVSGADTIPTTGLSPTTSSGTTDLYLCGTAATVGASTPVTGTVSSVAASGYGSADADTTGATLTVTPPPAITIGNGSAEPSNASISAGAVGAFDAFSLQTNTGTATVTAVAVSLTFSAGTPLTNVFVNSSSACTGTTYGTLASPVSGSNTITLSSSPAVSTTTGTTDLYLCGTAAGVTSSATVSGTVSSVTASGYASTDADTTSATLTVSASQVVTIGNGTDPGNTSISSPAAGAIDAFTLQTSTGTATVTAVTVTLSFSAGSPLTNVFVSSSSTCTGGTTYGTLSSPVSGSDTISTTGLNAGTTVGANLYLCGTASTVASTATVTGTVASVTASGYSSTDGDTTSATLTITAPAVLGTTTGSISASATSCTSVSVSASYTGDTDGDNTVTFSRSTDGTTFTTLAACTGVGGGANPRVCNDTTAAASTTYWYRAQFSDSTGGVAGTNPITTASGVSTGACAANLVLSNPGGQPAAGTLTVGASTWTLVGQLSLAASAGTVTLDSIGIVNGAAAPLASAGEVTLNLVNSAGTAVDATARWDGAKWVFGSIVDAATGQPISIGTTPVTFLVYATADYGAVAGDQLAMQVNPAYVTALTPATATTGTTFTASTFKIAAPAVDEGSAAGASAPMVSIVNPATGKIVSGSFLVQVYVYSPSAATILAKALTTDGTTPTCATDDAALAKDAHAYPAASGDAMYAKTLSLGIGTYTLKACARNATGTTVSAPVTITVRAAGAGDGNLLVRDDSAQLCSDCHAGVKTHSSETSSKYGTWSTTCRDCHTPHGTRNIYLFREQIVPPAVNGYQSTKNVYLATTTGDSNVSGASTPASSSFVNTDASGPCQACHTRTASPTGVARWRNTGNADTHYTAAAGTQPCTNCHSHESGFAAGESGGGTDCQSCHGDLFNPMNATASGYHHDLDNAWSGSTAGSGTTTYPTTAWTSSTSDTNRRCLACHVDHNIFRPDLNPTNGARAKNLRTAYGTAPTTTSGFTNTDFDATSGGICLSCHTAAQTKSYAQADGSTTTPPMSAAAFSASAHSYGAAATFDDGSTFSANCSKCHTDTNPKARQTSAYPNQFGLHDSLTRRIANRVNDSILAGTATGTETTTTLQDTSRAWTANQWAGYAVTIRDTSGTRTGVVKANTSNTLSLVDPWAAAPISGTTTYTLGDPMEERLCTQCHSGGSAGNDAFGAKAMSAAARSFDQYLKVYGTGTASASSTTLTGAGTAWWTGGSGATFTSGSQTVTGLTGVTSAMLGWSIENTAISPPRWYSIVATPSATSVTISPAYQGTTASGAGWAISIGDWYFRCDADTTGQWYRVTDVASATSATIYPAYGGAACSGSGYVVRSSPGHPMSAVAGRHRPDEATTAGWNAGSTRHVTCEDCHDPHQAKPGDHTPGSTSAANLGAVNTGAWGVSVAYSSRSCSGGTFPTTATSTSAKVTTTVTTTAACFASTDVGKNISVTDGTGASFVLAIQAYNSGTSVTTSGYFGAALSNATFTIGDPTSAPTITKVTSLSTSSSQYQLCLKCHSPYAYGTTPPTTSFFSSTGTGTATAQTDLSTDFNPFQLGFHPILGVGRNQPPSNANPSWAAGTAGLKANAPNTGLDNTFVDGWGARSIVTCTDCHQSESANDPWGPHGTANPWLLKGIDPNVTVTTTAGVTYPNACYYRGSANTYSGVPDTGDSKNLCLDCHRADVYGIVTSGGNTTGTACNGSASSPAQVAGITYASFARVDHPVDNHPHSNATSQGALTRFGIYCMQCHGGESIGAIHGTNDGMGGTGYSLRGKRLLNGATWQGVTRATTSAGVTCYATAPLNSVNTCAHHSGSATGNTANYNYDAGAD